MAARAQLVDEIIRPALAAGRTVVSDRFLLANVVYQAHAGGLNPKQVWDVGHVAVDGVVPDLMFVLDLDPEVAARRIEREPDRMESQGSEFRRKVREGYLIEARRSPDQIRMVDAARDIDTIQREIQLAARPFVEGAGLAESTSKSIGAPVVGP
jgi:dTMP kinase